MSSLRGGADACSGEDPSFRGMQLATVVAESRETTLRVAADRRVPASDLTGDDDLCLHHSAGVAALHVVAGNSLLEMRQLHQGTWGCEATRVQGERTAEEADCSQNAAVGCHRHQWADGKVDLVPNGAAVAASAVQRVAETQSRSQHLASLLLRQTAQPRGSYSCCWKHSSINEYVRLPSSSLLSCSL